MITFWEVFKAIIIGVVFGTLFVWMNKRVMNNYRRKYEAWWTPRRYKILFFAVTSIIGSAWILYYFLDAS